MSRSGPRKYPNAPAKWEEVWWWCSEITKRWGYDAKVGVYPPLPGKDKVRFIVLLELKRVQANDSARGSSLTKWRNVEDDSLTAEQVALTMAVELHRWLDSEEMERERQAYVAGALL